MVPIFSMQFSSYTAFHTCDPLYPAEAGSYLRLIDSCITQLTAQGPFRTCNESKAEEEEPSHHSCKAAFSKREFKLPWLEAGPTNHFDDKVVRTRRLVATPPATRLTYASSANEREPLPSEEGTT